MPAALEWLAAATSLDGPEEAEARLAIATQLSGDAREAMMVSAALVRARVESNVLAPFVVGQSPAVRLANLELAPPGSDPRRRGAALAEIDGALGPGAEAEAVSLLGWSALAANDVDGARSAFEKATTANPNDLASWEGLRSCAELSGNRPVRARAAAVLGALCKDASRGAAF